MFKFNIRNKKGGINWQLVTMIAAICIIIGAFFFPKTLYAKGKEYLDIIPGMNEQDISPEEISNLDEEAVAEGEELLIYSLNSSECCYYNIIKLDEGEGWEVEQEIRMFSSSGWYRFGDDKTIMKNVGLVELFSNPEIHGKLNLNNKYFIRDPALNNNYWFWDVNKDDNYIEGGDEIRDSETMGSEVMTYFYAEEKQNTKS